MRLRDMLDESTVKVGLESLDKEECIEEMTDVLVRAGRVADRAQVLSAVRTREAEGSTGIGKGVAVPHGKCAGLAGTVLAVGISKNGIEFDSADGRPVKIVFLIAASASEPGKHLQMLAEVVRLIRVPDLCDKLVAATTPKMVLDLLDSEE
ncbi:MAG: PTS sugar transporter subunit IIA [Kiritimatiellae bacterium]|nr:PTS sugar transporter subunit IIA [Kiritimatiellia bacterium]